MAAEPAALEEPFEVVGLRRCTSAILEVWLRPLAGGLDFLPGQYILLEDRDHLVPQRAYSIANAPRADRLISLLITRVPEGPTSTWAHQGIRIGDDVDVSGPYGTFLDDPLSAAPALLLAAGSGLAPIRSLVEASLAAGRRRSLTLIVSARTEDDIIDPEVFTGWESRHCRFRFVVTLTRAVGDLAHGRIPALLPSLHSELSDHDVFIAGNGGFVAACTAAAKRHGARHSRVHAEVFVADV